MIRFKVFGSLLCRVYQNKTESKTVPRGEKVCFLILSLRGGRVFLLKKQRTDRTDRLR